MERATKIKRVWALIASVALTIVAVPTARADDAPYDGTVFISPDVLTSDSRSDFLSLTYAGLSVKRTFDRRPNAWIDAPSHVFQARFECARRQVAVIVNAEINRRDAEIQAERFARVLGQLPFGSRKAVREIWVHPGDELAGGGNNAILMYTGYADVNARFLEEAFIHEAAHTTLDWGFGGVVNREEWMNAASADARFISRYAADNPDREDVAESYGAFLAYEAAQINLALRGESETIGYAMPNRIALFRSLGSEFGLSRASCPKYSDANQEGDQSSASTQQRSLVLVRKGKGISILRTTISKGGILEATVQTDLRTGTRVSIALRKGDSTEIVTQTVGLKGIINVRVNLASVDDVVIVDNRDQLMVRWRIR